MSVWKPHVTVAALVERDGRFLLVEEKIEGRTVLNQPAGHLEAGESLLEAVVRETLEETAHDFTPEAVTGLYRWTNPDNGLTFLRTCFSGRAGTHHADRALDEGILRAVWLSPEEIEAAAARLRSPMVLTCLRDHLAGCRYPLALLRDLGAEPK